MTELKLYNTLTRTKEVFEPIDPANVRMYVCGPTVYDFAHIGNARPVIVFDVLFRLLRHLAKQGVWDGGKGETKVTYVRNITDVEDKINARALRDFPGLPLNEAIANVTEKTANQFFADAAALGCLKPTAQPRATQHIDGMIAMIQTLIKKGHAYVATGKEGREVLFDVASMPDYGGLSKRNLEDQQAGARVAVEAHKKNPADFVLWKESSGDEPGWDANFDGTQIYGRPGWHIECSVMAKANLGEVFDIHGGGLDLIFPHHENEIAQSRCAHGTDVMAKVWMHNGFLQVEGRKMSKSEGNFVTIHDLLETEKFGDRKWPGEVLRLAMLMTHYREPIDFSVKRLEEAERLLDGWRREIVKRGIRFAPADRAAAESERVCAKVVSALANDLNMSEVIAALHWHADGNESYNGPRLFGSLQFLGLVTFDSMLAWMEEESAAEEQTAPPELETRLEERLALLAEKNFAEADAIRDELAAQGVQLMDYKDAETGERRTKWEVKR